MVTPPYELRWEDLEFEANLGYMARAYIFYMFRTGSPRESLESGKSFYNHLTVILLALLLILVLRLLFPIKTHNDKQHLVTYNMQWSYLVQTWCSEKVKH